MMPIEELRELQAEFEPVRLEKRVRHKEFQRQIGEFSERFPRSGIRQLSLDNYVQGKGDKDTFCYWVERETSDLGHIQGARSDKFGIYYSKEKGGFQYNKRFKNEEDARDRILTEIDELVAAAEKGDTEAICGSPISPMFKGKLLFLYFPNKFINIFSERHVDHYLRRLRVNEPGTELDLILKRERLYEVRNADEVMRDWSVFEFSDFLYWAWPPPSRHEKVPTKLQDYILDFPGLDETEPEFVEFQVGESPDSHETAASRRGGTTDFEKRNQRNKLTGNQGEDIVLKAERQRLEQGKRPDLAKQIKRVSKESDAAGFDILSFELDGNEKQIEVKSTTAKAPEPGGSFRFHLSANELEQARTHTNFHLYLVFDLKSKKPKIWPIANPASLEPKRLNLKPSAYHATVTIA